MPGAYPYSKPSRIDVYDNKHLSITFENKRLEFDRRGVSCFPTWVYHGTDSAAVNLIVKKGFKVGGKEVRSKNGAKCGQGIYTSPRPDMAISYGNLSASRSCKIILAKALFGRSSADNGKDGGDSWTLGDAATGIHVFKEGSQLLPVYVIHV